MTHYVEDAAASQPFIKQPAQAFEEQVAALHAEVVPAEVDVPEGSQLLERPRSRGCGLLYYRLWCREIRDLLRSFEITDRTSPERDHEQQQKQSQIRAREP